MYIYIYIYIYIKAFFIYSIAWMLISDKWFHVLLRQSSDRGRKIYTPFSA